MIPAANDPVPLHKRQMPAVWNEWQTETSLKTVSFRAHRFLYNEITCSVDAFLQVFIGSMSIVGVEPRKNFLDLQ